MSRWFAALTETLDMMRQATEEEDKDRMNRIWCMRRVPGNAAGDREVFAFHLEVWQRCSGQVLFGTRSTPVATCEGHVRVGDQAALLPGCAHPVVLRPGRNTYQFIGLAYVGDIMQGEAWRSEQYKRQKLHIV